jgi:hypothetical protein
VPRAFPAATAEQAIAAVEAVAVHGPGASPKFVARFADLTDDQAKAGLLLAADLGFLLKNGDHYEPVSPLCRFVTSGTDLQRASVTRIALESYEPFRVFRDRLVSTDAATAARQTKALLDLDAHHEDVKATLISLGTYTQGLAAAAGGQVLPATSAAEHTMEALAAGAEDLAGAEARIRQQLGPTASHAVSTNNVVVPLSDALLRAGNGDGRGAVVTAANAVESFLLEIATRLGVNVAGATGLNSKLNRFSDGQIPKKVKSMGKYLGDVRNAADHGVDADVGQPWTIRPATGVEFVYVSCSFIANCMALEAGEPPQL